MSSHRMAELGRKGGLLGGPARARALPPKRRQEIARDAARTRWQRPVLFLDRAPRGHGELSAFVAHFGTRVAKGEPGCDLADVALRAVKSGRRDPALTRMLPVFLWRARNVLDLDVLVRRAQRQRQAPAVGYFLELAATLGGAPKLARAARRLRVPSHRRPLLYFESAARNPFEAMAARERTPEPARRWGLVTGTPTDSFSTYFQKVRGL